MYVLQCLNFRQPPTNDSGALQSVLQLTDPYGIQKCLEGLTPKKPGEITYATNPQEIQKILESPKYTPPILSANTKKLKMFPPSNKKVKFKNNILKRLFVSYFNALF